MAYTSHGHHIAGTQLLGTIPDHEVEACGGPGVCRTCQKEAAEKIAESLDSEAQRSLTETWRLVTEGYKLTRERQIVLTRLEEAELWLTKCEPQEKGGYGIITFVPPDNNKI